MLDGRRIVLGVTGGIAAYKAIDVCRRLVDLGAHVVPVMTTGAQRFVGAATFSALASEPVQTALFGAADPIPHTTLGQGADLVVVAPATARLLSAYVSGYSHDLLTSTLLATRAPVLVCPAMHTEMWEHPAVQDNLATLRRRGVHVVEPESGRLAGGDIGHGRLASPESIVAAAVALLAPRDLTGLRIVVSAGGTREPIDPVRFIGNRSSGKQGHAIARAAVARGAQVVLVTTTDRDLPAGVEVIRVETAAEMADAVLGQGPSADVVVMAAAVADFRPKETVARKLKKQDGIPSVELEPTRDILSVLGSAKVAGQTIVGFAAETNDLRRHAGEKLARKGADLIVANDVSAPGVGFEHDTNEVVILTASGREVEIEFGDKAAIANALLDVIVEERAGNNSGNNRERIDMTSWTFTSESVTEGHPDKMADQISDSVLDAILAVDPAARVACETLVTTGLCVVAGEITTTAYVDIPSIARETIKGIGYDRESFGYDGNTCGVLVALDEQSPDIAQGVDDSEEVRSGSAGENDLLDKQGAGDQGMMFGYACDETDVLMPLPIHLAHRLSERLAEVRKAGTVPYLRPDGKTQVTFEYEGNRPVALKTVLISTQHNDGIDRDTEIRPDLIEHVIRPVIPEQFAGDDYEIYVNPTGKFVIGGPVGDCGLTGRKIIVDTYGGMARHGGGAFSGKDPSKVDRSAAYAARWVAKNVVASGAATRCEVQVAYAIGVAHPLSILVETFGTATVDPSKVELAVKDVFDLRPGAIVRDLDLRRPVFQQTAAYGHFGRSGDGFTWELTNRVDDLRSALGL